MEYSDYTINYTFYEDDLQTIRKYPIRELRYPNGQLLEQTELKKNKRYGMTTTWYANGDLFTQATYMDDNLYGVVHKWYPSREPGYPQQLEELITYYDGIKHGEYKRWYPDGNCHIACTYHNNRLCGEVVEYLEDGSVKSPL